MDYDISLKTDVLGRIIIELKKSSSNINFKFNPYEFFILIEDFFKELEGFFDEPLLKDFLKKHNSSYCQYELMLYKIALPMYVRYKEKEEEKQETWKDANLKDLRERISHMYQKWENTLKEDGNKKEREAIIDLLNQTGLFLLRLNEIKTKEVKSQ